MTARTAGLFSLYVYETDMILKIQSKNLSKIMERKSINKL